MPVVTAKDAIITCLHNLRKSAFWFESSSGIIGAISGGPDSLALAFLTAEVCAEQKIQFEAVLVNHGLRKEAATEASYVIEKLESRGIQACCLSVTASPPSFGK